MFGSIRHLPSTFTNIYLLWLLRDLRLLSPLLANMYKQILPTFCGRAFVCVFWHLGKWVHIGTVSTAWTLHKCFQIMHPYSTLHVHYYHALFAVLQTQQSQSRIGPLSYMSAVKLGLFNIKTGKYRDPISGLTLGIQDAVSRGFIQANGDAITNLNTGRLCSAFQRQTSPYPEKYFFFCHKQHQIKIQE